MIAIVASVVLSGLFGTATATVEKIDADVMMIDLEVEVTPAAVGSVVAHLLFEDDPDLTLPLLDRGDGVYGVRTEVEPKNYLVVFEIIGEQSGMSEPVSLIQLGAEITVGSGAETQMSDDEDEPESFQMLWLGVALAAASLSALAFWVLGGRDDETDEADGADSDEDADAEDGEGEPVAVSEEE